MSKELPASQLATPEYTETLFSAGDRLLGRLALAGRGLNEYSVITAPVPLELDHSIEVNCYELPYDSKVSDIKRTMVLKCYTQDAAHQRLSRNPVNLHEPFEITLERETTLIDDRGKRAGAFVLTSNIAYTCSSSNKTITRELPEVVSDNLDQLRRGMTFARSRDPLLYAGMYEHWTQAENNRAAIAASRYEDVSFMAMPNFEADKLGLRQTSTSEVLALVALIDDIDPADCEVY